MEAVLGIDSDDDIDIGVGVFVVVLGTYRNRRHGPSSSSSSSSSSRTAKVAQVPVVRPGFVRTRGYTAKVCARTADVAARVRVVVVVLAAGGGVKAGAPADVCFVGAGWSELVPLQRREHGVLREQSLRQRECETAACSAAAAVEVREPRHAVAATAAAAQEIGRCLVVQR